jgi:putative oxidoreductase
MIKLLTMFYQFLIRFGVYLLPVVLLIIRLAWGWELFQSGHSHLQDVPGMTARFESWGIPQAKANVYISGYTEMIGGLLMMGGLASRVVSIPLIINFCVAYLTASHDNVVKFFHNIPHQDPSILIDDAAFPFLVMSLLILAAGPGVLSIDGLLKYTIFRKKAATAPPPSA